MIYTVLLHLSNLDTFYLLTKFPQAKLFTWHSPCMT